jgi:hypothetical protein
MGTKKKVSGIILEWLEKTEKIEIDIRGES